MRSRSPHGAPPAAPGLPAWLHSFAPVVPTARHGTPRPSGTAGASPCRQGRDSKSREVTARCPALRRGPTVPVCSGQALRCGLGSAGRAACSDALSARSAPPSPSKGWEEPGVPPKPSHSPAAPRPIPPGSPSALRPWASAAVTTQPAKGTACNVTAEQPWGAARAKESKLQSHPTRAEPGVPPHPAGLVKGHGRHWGATVGLWGRLNQQGALRLQPQGSVTAAVHGRGPPARREPATDQTSGTPTHHGSCARDGRSRAQPGRGEGAAPP